MTIFVKTSSVPQFTMHRRHLGVSRSYHCGFEIWIRLDCDPWLVSTIPFLEGFNTVGNILDLHHCRLYPLFKLTCSCLCVYFHKLWGTIEHACSSTISKGISHSRKHLRPASLPAYPLFKLTCSCICVYFHFWGTIEHACSSTISKGISQLFLKGCWSRLQSQWSF